MEDVKKCHGEIFFLFLNWNMVLTNSNAREFPYIWQKIKAGWICHNEDWKNPKLIF